MQNNKAISSEMSNIRQKETNYKDISVGWAAPWHEDNDFINLLNNVHTYPIDMYIYLYREEGAVHRWWMCPPASNNDRETDTKIPSDFLVIAGGNSGSGDGMRQPAFDAPTQ